MARCGAVLAACLLFLPLALAGILVQELEAWWLENKDRLRLEREAQREQRTERFLRTTLKGETFDSLSGGAPVRCHDMLCTVCFCWALDNATQRCLTASHVRAHDSSGQLVVLLKGKHVTGEVHDDNDRLDWLTFDVPHPSQQGRGLDLMHGFDTIAVVGYRAAQEGEAVWKLGHQSGVSIGRVVHINDTHFRIDGMLGQPGDSGGVVCLGESFITCTVVGMVLAGNSSTLIVEAVRFDKVAPLAEVPLHLVPVHKTEVARLDSELAQAKMRQGHAQERHAKELAEAETQHVKELAEARQALAQAEAETRHVKERHAKELAEAETRHVKELAEARQALARAEAEARHAKELAEAEARHAKELAEVRQALTLAEQWRASMKDGEL